MPDDPNLTDALNQALREVRMGDAEKSTMEIISRALGIPIEIVHRVVFARELLKNVLPARLGILFPATHWREYIPDDDVRAALEARIDEGIRRITVRWTIENNRDFEVEVKRLLKPKDVNKICRGCPDSMECVAGSLHTPQECYDGRIPKVKVVPLRIIKNTVEVRAEHPTGTYVIPLEGVPMNHRFY